MLVKKLIICSIMIFLGIYYILASYGKTKDSHEKIIKIANSIKIGTEEDRIGYVKLIWRIGAFICLVIGTLGIIITLATGGKVLVL